MRALIFILCIVLTSFTPDRNSHTDAEPLFNMINEYRASNGIPKLKYLHSEQEDTDAWSRKQIRYLQHKEGPFFENCAGGYYSIEQTLEGWKKSLKHNRNLLNRSIKYATVSIYVVRYSTYEKHYSVFRGYRTKKGSN